MFDETRLLTCKTVSLAGLREVLAREACGKEVDILRQPLQFGYVIVKGYARETNTENRLRTVIDLAEQACAMTSPFESEFKPSNTSK